MIIRHILNRLAWPLAIVSVITFTLVFVVSLVMINNLNDTIRLQAPLTAKDENKWAQMPGYYNYTYTKEVYLFNLIDLDQSEGVAINL